MREHELTNPSSSAGTTPFPVIAPPSLRAHHAARRYPSRSRDARRSPARDTGNAGRSPAHDTDDAPPPPRDDEPSPAEPDASPAGPVAVHTPAPVAPRPLPDLVITDLSNVSVAIANHGDAATGPFEVEVDGLAEPLLFPDGLAAGGSTTAGYSCLAPDAFAAIIDPAGTIDESDETNNAASARGMC